MSEIVPAEIKKSKKKSVDNWLLVVIEKKGHNIKI